MVKETVVQKLRQHPNFHQLVVGMDAQTPIRDAEFLVRQDGMIFNADGYAHPHNTAVGAVLYAPKKEGTKQFFGVSYQKTTQFPQTYEPIPYQQRGKFLQNLDPQLDQASINPPPFTYEQILPRNQFVGVIPADKAFTAAMSGALGNADELRKDFENVLHLLQISSDRMTFGLTGAPALGNIEHYHDLDIVFRGTVSQNRQLADVMRDLVIREPDRRLHEGGKSWLIRFFNRNGISNGNLMCCFFGYADLGDAPLREFRFVPHQADVEIRGSVADAQHALYTPTVVYLHDTHTAKIDGKPNGQRLSDGLELVVYHTGSRGEFNVGDELWAHGVLGQISTPRGQQQALVVVDREGTRNETPPWPNYYSRSRT